MLLIFIIGSPFIDVAKFLRKCKSHNAASGSLRIINGFHDTPRRPAGHMRYIVAGHMRNIVAGHMRNIVAGHMRNIVAGHMRNIVADHCMRNIPFVPFLFSRYLDIFHVKRGLAYMKMQFLDV